MALDNLATVEQLEARKVDVSDDDAITDLLRSASAAVRDAAGCSITLTQGTVSFMGSPSLHLRLPGWAIRSVSAVQVDGVTITDWKFLGATLFRRAGWGSEHSPVMVTVTYSMGIDECPDDIVDLVASLVAAGLASADDGYDPHRGTSAERIDDYQRSFTRGEDEVVSPMELPEATRTRLARRFGGGVYVTGSLA